MSDLAPTLSNPVEPAWPTLTPGLTADSLRIGDIKPPRSIWEDLTPGLAYVKNNIAKLSLVRGGRDWAFSPENIGKTVDDLERERQQEHAAQVAVKVASETAHLPDEQFNQIADQVARTSASPPLVPEQAPLLDPTAAQTGVSALAGVLDPRHAAEYGAVPYQYQLGEQVRADSMAQARWKQEMETWKTTLGSQGDMAQLQSQRDLETARLANDAIERKSRADLAEENRKLQEAIRNESDVTRLAGQFYNAKNGAAARIAGKRLQAIDKVAPPSDAEIEAHAQAADSDQVASALKDWRAERQFLLNAFGEIDDQRAPEAEATRKAIARQYGGGDEALTKRIEDLLPPAPTGETLRKQQIDQRSKEFSERLSHLDQQHRDDLAMKMADLDLAEKRLNWMVHYQGAMLDNATYGRMLEKYKAAQAAAKSAVSPELQKAEADARGKNAAVATAQNTLDAALKALKAKSNDGSLKAAANRAQANLEYWQQESAQAEAQASYLRGLVPADKTVTPPPEPPPARDTGGFQSGNVTNRTSKALAISALQASVQKAFPGVRIERNGPGSIPDSLHKEGLALDLHGGDLKAMADWAMKQPGVKVVIYNGQIWTPDKGIHPYHGPSPHTDHVHVDMGGPIGRSKPKADGNPSPRAGEPGSAFVRDPKTGAIVPR